jgi:hypothetical protein
MEHHYHALRTIGMIYRILGYIVLGLTILAFLGICVFSVVGGTAASSISRQYGYGTGILSGIGISLLALIYGGITAISLIAFGEGINLLIALEENTRKTAMLLENHNKPVESLAVPAGN